MKRLFLLCMTICVILICHGCESDTDFLDAPELSPEADLMWKHFDITEDIVQHNSLDELLNNCATEDIKAVMAKFPVDKFENVYYFNTYYLYDFDLNFPTSVIAFEDGGATYYFSGAEWMNNPFSLPYDDSTLTYAAKDTSRAFVQKNGGRYSCEIELPGSDSDYALTPISDMSREAFFNVLSTITGGEYRCVRGNYIDISGNKVGYSNILYSDYTEIGYTLSNPGVLEEVSLSFKKGEAEIVDFSDSSDPNAIGADLVNMPDSIYIEFVAVGEGQTVLEVFADNHEVLWTVTIEVDEDGAFMPDY